MKPSNILKSLGLGVLAIAILSGCGAQSFQQAASVSGNITDPTPTPTPTWTITPTPTPTPTGTVPNYTYSFQVVGHIAGQAGSTATISGISTDNILKIKVVPGPTGGIGGGASGNYPTDYGCVSYRITVLGQSVQTSSLYMAPYNSTCPSAATSQVIDFSSRLTPGHGAVDIKVDNVMTDARYWSCLKTWPSYYCQNFYPMVLNYDARMNGYVGAWIATGSLEIQVNGTVGF